MERLTLSRVANPFDAHRSRVSKEVDFMAGKTLAEYLEDLPKQEPGSDTFEHVVSVNGRVVEDMSFSPGAGDHVVTVAKIRGGGGGSKNTIRTIALIGVMVAAAAFTGGAIAPFIGGGTFGSILSGTLVAVGGSYLVNTALPVARQELPRLSTPVDQSQTYGWGVHENNYLEGVTLPVIYGVHRVFPPLISNHVTTDGDNQYLNMLFAVADGQVDSIADIEINGNPSSNYTGISIVTRLGTNSQTVIPFFQDTITEKVSGGTVNYPSYVTVTTDGSSVEGLGVGITFPQGLAFINPETGEYENENAVFSVEYSVAGMASWQPFPGSPYTVTDKRAQTIRKYYRKDNITPGQYDIRVGFTDKPRDGAEHLNDMLVEYIQEIIYDDFTYPNTALLAVKALATDQLNGSRPAISCLVTRANVPVWNGEEYLSLPANNPAWACFDMLHDSLYGAGIDGDRLLYTDFLAWALWCSNQSLTCNMYFDTASTMHDMLGRISTIGRGSIIQRGTNIGAVADKTGTPVQTFTIGNVAADSFEESFIEKANRANAISITYFDENRDYERTTVEVLQDGFDADTGLIRKTDVVLPGCTSKDIALRHAKFLLNKNKYLMRLIKFSADLDAIICQVGDLISFSHDVPQWGFGGRVVSATSNTIVLDREVTMETGTTYVVLVRSDADNTTEELTVEAVLEETTTDTLTLTSTWATIPSASEIYAFGVQNSNVKEFTVTEMYRDQDGRCRITAMEYRSEVYDDTLDIPDYENESNLPHQAGLRLAAIYRVGQDGVVRAEINATWRGFAVQWKVFVREDGGDWRRVGTTNVTQFVIAGLDVGKTYEVAVSDTDSPESGISDTIELTFVPPSAVTGLSSQVIDNFVLLRWTGNPGTLPIAYYEVRRGTVFGSSELVGKADKTFTTVMQQISGTYTYWVVPVDTAGVRGDEASVQATVAQPLDYVLYDTQLSDFSGTKSDTVTELGKLYGPISDSETWEDWFDDNGFTTFQEFIDHGYIYYPQPSGATSGYYEEVFDYGVELTGVGVRLDIDFNTFTGDATKTSLVPTLSISTNGSDYTDYAGQYSLDSGTFRYVKVRLDLYSDGIQVMEVTKLEVSLNLREVADGGNSSVSSANDGKVVSFNRNFYDVSAITVTAGSAGSPLYPVYDFTDTPNPTSFTVYLFDETGTKVTGNFSWMARGLING